MLLVWIQAVLVLPYHRASYDVASVTCQALLPY
jgi:hypothetical protein